MANGRPTGDGPGHPPRRRGDRVANQEGLSALGREMGGGADTGRVANESGLRALGTRIDNGKSRRRRSGRPRWSLGKKVGVVLAAVLLLAASGAQPAGPLVEHRVAGVVFHIQVHGRFRTARKILDHADDLADVAVVYSQNLNPPPERQLPTMITADARGRDG